MPTAVHPSELEESARRKQVYTVPCHPSQQAHHHVLALEICHNLRYQHNWSDLRIHNLSPVSMRTLPRPMVSGMPPHRVYVHPDDQAEEIKLGLKDGDVVNAREWILPTRLREKWSLARFGDVFDAIDDEPASSGIGIEELVDPRKLAGSALQEAEGKRKHPHRLKRVLLATVADDSTVVYYIVHDGIVKPRQN